MADTEWVLLIQDDGGDYYVGEDAALYRDGERVWEGASADTIESIAVAILGEGVVQVRRAVWPSFPWGTHASYHFAERLADQPEPKAR